MIADHVTAVAAGPAFASAQRVSWAIIAFWGLVALSVGGLTTGAWGRRRARANGERMRAGAVGARGSAGAPDSADFRADNESVPSLGFHSGEKADDDARLHPPPPAR